MGRGEVNEVHQNTFRFPNIFHDYCIAPAIRAQSLVINEWTSSSSRPINRSTVRRLCFFSHFDPDNKVDDYVFHYLRMLSGLGMDLIFVSTCGSLPDSVIQSLQCVCLSVIIRKNIGLDFGSWKIGMLQTAAKLSNFSSYDYLVFANDSVFGPLYDLQPIFDKMDRNGYNFWGLSSSGENGYHIQSYFLVCDKQYFMSSEFYNFWAKFIFLKSKRRIIRNYEIGFSQVAIRNHFRVGAFIECSAISPDARNPTLFHWDTIIRVSKFPFLKKQVVMEDSIGSFNSEQWKKTMQGLSDYPFELIDGYLNRFKCRKKRK
jgi:lipopolysaccharide biosynthesis protein